MRIAYFNCTLKENLDGVSNFIFTFISFLDKKNVEKIIFSARILNINLSTKIFKVSSAQIPFYNKYRLAFPSWINVDRPLKKFRPDIVHIMFPDSPISNLWF
jgi:hypothetical protein